jgi:hypothetical protein
LAPDTIDQPVLPDSAVLRIWPLDLGMIDALLTVRTRTAFTDYLPDIIRGDLVVPVCRGGCPLSVGEATRACGVLGRTGKVRRRVVVDLGAVVFRLRDGVGSP